MVNKLLFPIIGQGYFRFTPRWGLASIGHYLRCRGRVVLSPEGVFILGGRSCPRRAERSRDLGKMLVRSGESTLRRQNDPPGLKCHPGTGIPSKDKLTLLRKSYFRGRGGRVRWNRCALSLYIALILFGEGALLSGGWNGCVFYGKCWWVLEKAPSGDEFALQSIRKTRYRARFSRLGGGLFAQGGKGNPLQNTRQSTGEQSVQLRSSRVLRIPSALS